ncbi:hypothetical protein THIOM_000466, partial [Candidatus Thiomargarita nelsonii]
FFNSLTRDKWVNGPPAEDAHYLIDWVKFFPLRKALPKSSGTSRSGRSKGTGNTGNGSRNPMVQTSQFGRL